MWIISEKKSINLDKISVINLGASYTFCYEDSDIVFYNSPDNKTILNCNTFENAKEILKDINQALYDGKKTFNFDAHLNYIEKRRKNND